MGDFDIFTLALIAIAGGMMLSGAAFLAFGMYTLRGHHLSARGRRRWLRRLTRAKILPPSYPASLETIDALIAYTRRQSGRMAVAAGLGFVVIPIVEALIVPRVPGTLSSGDMLPLTVAGSLFTFTYFLVIALPVLLLNRDSGTQESLSASETGDLGQQARAWYLWIGAINLLAALACVALTAIDAAGAIPRVPPPTAEEVAILAAPWLLWLGPTSATVVSLGELAFLLRWPTRTRPITSDPIIDELAHQWWHRRIYLLVIYPGVVAGMVVMDQALLLHHNQDAQGMVATLVTIAPLAGIASMMASMVAMRMLQKEVPTAWLEAAYA